jgi:hypothetical protein
MATPTKSWYVPHTYRSIERPDGFVVVINNGAGQRIGESPPLLASAAAHMWQIDHADNRARCLGAYLEDEPMPKESGQYAPGTEFDPRAPWNQHDEPEEEQEDAMCHPSDFDHLTPSEGHTGRFHVHGTITSTIGIAADIAFTITLDGDNDEEVQAIVMDLISEPADITEIEPAPIDDLATLEDEHPDAWHKPELSDEDL